MSGYWFVNRDKNNHISPFKSALHEDATGKIRIIAGQISDIDGKLNGLGRKICLVPQKNENNKIIGYKEEDCNIQEGFFEEGILYGFSRTIHSDGDYDIGWNKNGGSHGYCKTCYEGETQEGLF